MQKITRHFATILIACFIPIALPASAESESAFFKALEEGEVSLKARYRFEHAESDARDQDARASTLRTELGYKTEAFHGFTAGLAFEDIRAIGPDDYDSTINGNTNRVVVADPEATEVNQAWVAYEGIEKLRADLGRQVITFGNHRFVGDVGWRQNQQTYDAVRLRYSVTETVDLDAAYLDNVNRIFGDDAPNGDFGMESFIGQLNVTLEEWGRLSVFGLALDSDDAPAISTTTTGVRGWGEQKLGGLDLLYDASFAHQSDAGDNPNEVDQEYIATELGLRQPEWKTVLKVGWERLGGSGEEGDVFSTPLATLHKFNGWADIFLNTPTGGLEDLYVSLSGNIARINWSVTYHDFSSDAGGQDFGDEIDVVLTRPLNEHLKLGLKGAQYNADEFGADTSRLWAWLSYAKAW